MESKKKTRTFIVDKMSGMRVSGEIDNMDREKEPQLTNFSKDRDSRKDLIHQYVINISLEPSMTAWLKEISNIEQILRQNEKDEGMTQRRKRDEMKRFCRKKN